MCYSKIAKLKLRRAADFSKKFCANCKKDFNPNENYNWSCQTHRSEWGGTMWWCCGKTKLNAPGCKFQKHKQKDDEMDDDDDTRKNEQNINIRCESCKEAGHRAIECDKDPNLRTTFDVGDELTRLSKM